MYLYNRFCVETFCATMKIGDLLCGLQSECVRNADGHALAAASLADASHYLRHGGGFHLEVIEVVM